MSGRHPLRAALPLLACVLALFAQVTGAHLHLCFDGAEPPISAHLSAAPEHGDHHEDGTHTDLDLAWVGGTLAKPHDAAPGALPMLLAAPWRLPLAAAAPGLSPRLEAVPPLASPPPHLRPPLRGPPPIPA